MDLAELREDSGEWQRDQLDTGVRGSNAAIQSGSPFGRIDRPCVIDYVAFLHVGGFSKELNDVSGCSASPVDGCFHGPHFLTRTALLAALLGRRCGFYPGPSFLGKPRAYKSFRFSTLLL
jgi:hypothetical protein